jgi:hypothetical protein
MRSSNLEKRSLHREENDIGDWYVIGSIAVASLAMWLLLLIKVPV